MFRNAGPALAPSSAHVRGQSSGIKSLDTLQGTCLWQGRIARWGGHVLARRNQPALCCFECSWLTVSRQQGRVRQHARVDDATEVCPGKGVRALLAVLAFGFWFSCWSSCEPTQSMVSPPPPKGFPLRLEPVFLSDEDPRSRPICSDLRSLSFLPSSVNDTDHPRNYFNPHQTLTQAA